MTVPTVSRRLTRSLVMASAFASSSSSPEASASRMSMASNGNRADSVVRVLVAGALDHGVTEQLKARSDLLFLEACRTDDSDANKPDVVVYVASAGYLLDNDVSVLRSWTNAPIVLATDAPRD